MGLLSGIGDFVSGTVGKITDGVRGLGRVARGKFGEGLGDIAGGVSAVAPFIPGLGPVAKGAIGALGGLMGGGSISDAAAAGMDTHAIAQAMQQSQEDQQRARDLVDQAVDRSGQGADLALGEFNKSLPLREEFRSGAMGFHDPTNPFARAGGGGSGAEAAGMQPEVAASPGPVSGMIPPEVLQRLQMLKEISTPNAGTLGAGGGGGPVGVPGRGAAPNVRQAVASPQDIARMQAEGGGGMLSAFAREMAGGHGMTDARARR